jgi:radical SAM protein with 4Fe4S-binding SPASM domain
MNDLNLLAINLTKRCNLACSHCYLDAKTLEHGASDELSCDEVCALLDSVAERNTEAMVVLTGGEPLLRPDLEAMVRHGSGLGLAMVAGTNGIMLSERRVLALKEAGLLGAGISVDSLEPDRHDSFRGKPGSWQKTMSGIEACRRHGLSFQIHFTVTQHNAHELSEVIAFCADKGARVLNVFFLICTGRGESLVDIGPQQYEVVIREIIEAQAQNPDLIIRPRCAPHYKRIAHQLNPDAAITSISGQEGDGCIAATHYCRVTPTGGVTACPYIDTSVGSIREQSLPEIWDRAPQFQALRNPQLAGKCGDCEYRKLCGGCRARPLAAGGGILDADPWCAYQPSGEAVIEPLSIAGNEVSWSKEAETRISRAPGFVRKMVRKRAEAYALECGETIVTVNHLDQLTARRFGSNKPPAIVRRWKQR